MFNTIPYLESYRKLKYLVVFKLLLYFCFSRKINMRQIWFSIFISNLKRVGTRIAPCETLDMFRMSSKSLVKSWRFNICDGKGNDRLYVSVQAISCELILGIRTTEIEMSTNSFIMNLGFQIRELNEPVSKNHINCRDSEESLNWKFDSYTNKLQIQPKVPISKKYFDT